MNVLGSIQLTTLLLMATRCYADHSSCAWNWHEGDNCGHFPETPTDPGTGKPDATGTFTDRTSIPSFVLDTAFRVVDGKADMKWMATVKDASKSLADKIAEGFVDGLGSVLPFSEVFQAGYSVLSAAGIELLDGTQEPLQVDLTNLVKDLKENILDLEEQDDFLDLLGVLSAQYETFSGQLQLVRDTKDLENKLNLLTFVLGRLSETFNTEIQAPSWKDNKFSLFMINPLVSHASLHYTAVLLSTAAQMNLYSENKHDHPDIPDDLCTYLTSFEKDMTDYQTSLLAFHEQAVSDRMDSVGLSSCSEDCDAYDKWATYTWKDNWPLLGMETFSEGWKTTESPWGGHEISGIYTDGKELEAEVAAYRKQATTELNAWKDAALAAIKKMAKKVTKLAVKACSQSSVARAGVSTFV